MEQRFRAHPKNKGRARKADRKVKTIAGRLTRELGRKLAPGLYEPTLELFKKVLLQRNPTFIRCIACMNHIPNV